MDFGRILDDWEKIKREHKDSSQTQPAKAAMEAWLEANEVSDKDSAADAAAERARDAGHRRVESRRLAVLKSEAVLDLHGLKAEEAASSIADFLESASQLGLEKVLVIHGKGLHSDGAPVLKRAARRALEAHPLAGRFGEAARSEGGSGALWVLLRRKAN